jgi:hypothetical protein
MGGGGGNEREREGAWREGGEKYSRAIQSVVGAIFSKAQNMYDIGW